MRLIGLTAVEKKFGAMSNGGKLKRHLHVAALRLATPTTQNT
jgi:hypothetical protein